MSQCAMKHFHLLVQDNETSMGMAYSTSQMVQIKRLHLHSLFMVVHKVVGMMHGVIDGIINHFHHKVMHLLLLIFMVQIHMDKTLRIVLQVNMEHYHLMIYN